MSTYLFKYLTPKRLDDIIISKKILFTKPAEFNDPFEIPRYMIPRSEKDYQKDYQSFIDKLGKFIDKKLARADDRWEIMWDELETLLNVPAYLSPFYLYYWCDWYCNVEKEVDEREKLRSGYPWEILKPSQKAIITRDTKDNLHNINNKYVILSLTTHWDSLLMWSHYADSHKGVVIEFDVDHPEFNRLTKTRNFKTVDIDTFGKFADKSGTQVKGFVTYKKENRRLLLIPEIRIAMRHFFQKSYQWDYENEYRIVRLRADSEDSDQLNIGAKFSLPSAALKSIIIGARFGETKDDEEQNKLEVKKILNEFCNDQQLNHDDVYKNLKSILYRKPIKLNSDQQDNTVNEQVEKIRNIPELSHVKIYKVNISNTHYKLERVEI